MTLKSLLDSINIQVEKKIVFKEKMTYDLSQGSQTGNNQVEK